jgi:cytoskeletal protein CcmA (bactofilin family)
MPDPKGHASDPTIEDSLLKSSPEKFADLLSDTFNAWLADLTPQSQQEPEPIAKPEPSIISDAQSPGEFRFEGTLRLDGYAAGRLRSVTGTLILGAGSDLKSDIVVATLITDGAVHGNIHATERVELQSHAKVIGNIESPTIAIQPGAIFEGQCHFLPVSSSS